MNNLPQFFKSVPNFGFGFRMPEKQNSFTYNTKYNTQKYNYYYNHFTALWTSDFFWDNPGEPVPEETFTHSHISWSSIIPYLLPPSFTIHGILLVQFTCLTVFFTISLQGFFGLPLGLAPSTSYSNHCILFTAHIQKQNTQKRNTNKNTP